MAKLPTPIEYEIMELTHIWKGTGNPAAAWRAFHLARSNRIEVPAPVAAEIDRFAEAVTAPLNTDRDTITKDSVAVAWGIKKGHKPAMELRGDLRDLEIYMAFWQFRRGERTTRSDYRELGQMDRGEALAAVAADFGMSQKTAEEILTGQFETEGRDDPYERRFEE